MRFRAPLLALFPLLAACGGSGPPHAASPSSAGNGAAARDATAGSPDDDGPAPLRCDDGSCFPCGDGVCPSGFYCAVERDRQGCAWIPTCAARSSCACLAPVMALDAGCACEERDGGVYVTCGGAATPSPPK